MTWSTECPYITVPLTYALAKIYGKNYHLLGIFIASFAKHTIENKDSLSAHKAIEPGLQSMIKVYNKGVGIKKSKEMENLISIMGRNLQEYYIFQKFDIRKE